MIRAAGHAKDWKTGGNCLVVALCMIGVEACLVSADCCFLVKSGRTACEFKVVKEEEARSLLSNSSSKLGLDGRPGILVSVRDAGSLNGFGQVFDILFHPIDLLPHGSEL